MGDPRSCGDCTACCTALAIETAELRKAPGVTCVHCTAAGCGIYAARYPTCRTYFCGWFDLPELGADWRPDRSGLLISPHDAGEGEGIEFLVLGGEAAIRRPAFLALLARLLGSGIPVFLAVPGPAGHYPARTPLNDALSRIDPARHGDALAGTLAAAKTHRFEPVRGA